VILRLCLVLLPATAGAAQPWGAPALGSALSALDAGGYVCTADAARTQCRLAAGADLSVYGVPARERVLTYRDGLLAQVRIGFDESRFEQVLRACESKLGRAEIFHERLRAGMGGVFTSRIAVWRQKEAVVLLEQYFERVTRSAVSIMPPPAFEALMAARDRRRVRGVRDL
jgi:hypothetical protein